MTFTDVLIQQVVNGLALGMMYALLALGFTMVYGIIELINFAHFSVFMSGTFIGLIVLNLLGFTGESKGLLGFALVGTLVFVIINVVQLWFGPQTKPFPKIVPDIRWAIGHAEVSLSQILLFVAGLVL